MNVNPLDGSATPDQVPSRDYSVYDPMRRDAGNGAGASDRTRSARPRRRQTARQHNPQEIPRVVRQRGLPDEFAQDVVQLPTIAGNGAPLPAPQYPPPPAPQQAPVPPPSSWPQPQAAERASEPVRRRRQQIQGFVDDVGQVQQQVKRSVDATPLRVVSLSEMRAEEADDDHDDDPGQPSTPLQWPPPQSTGGRAKAATRTAGAPPPASNPLPVWPPPATGADEQPQPRRRGAQRPEPQEDAGGLRAVAIDSSEEDDGPLSAFVDLSEDVDSDPLGTALGIEGRRGTPPTAPIRAPTVLQQIVTDAENLPQPTPTATAQTTTPATSTDSPLQVLRSSPQLAELLRRMPLTSREVRLISDELDRSPLLLQIITRLAGWTQLAMETAEREAGALEQLHGEIGALRQATQDTVQEAGTAKTAHTDPVLLLKLLQGVTEQRVLREGWDLTTATPDPGSTPGNPRLLGLVQTVSLFAWQNTTGSNGPGKDPFAPEGSAQDFLGRLLGRCSRANGKQGVPMPGEYLLGAVDIQVGTQTTPIWFLCQINRAGQAAMPSRREDGQYRLVQGLVDGLVVREPRSGRLVTVSDQSGYAPMVLTRRLVRAREGSTRTGDLPDNLVPDREGTFFVEPAWFAARCGLFDSRAGTREADANAARTALEGHRLAPPPDNTLPGAPPVVMGPLASVPTLGLPGDPRQLHRLLDRRPPRQ